jgi:organic hydroperoxide reductase OsmC/OhrA
VRYRLRVAPDADRAAIDRVMGFHADNCPVARSIRDAIDVTTDIDVIEE